MLTSEEIVNHVQHMGCEEMDVELIENDEDDVDMEPSKMTHVECRESLEGNANSIAQDACLGDEDLLQVQRLANNVLVIQATGVMNWKREGINKMLDIMRFEIFTQLFPQHMHTCNHIHSLRQPMF